MNFKEEANLRKKHSKKINNHRYQKDPDFDSGDTMYEPFALGSSFVNPNILTTMQMFKILHHAGLYSIFDFGYQMSKFSEQVYVTSHQVNDHVNFFPCSKSLQNILKYLGIFNLVCHQLELQIGDHYNGRTSRFHFSSEHIQALNFTSTYRINANNL